MDSQQQQFCLKWNSFGSNLATAFGNLFKSESLTDVTLFCEGVSLKAHKVILAACSKHFQDLFEVAPPCPGTLVILDGTSASNMAALLEFMYKGEVHVSQDCLSSFLKAAECLQVKGLSIEHEKLAGSESQHSPSSSGPCHYQQGHHMDGRTSPICQEGQTPPRKQPKLNNINHSVPSPSSDPTDLTSPTTPTTSSGQFQSNSVIAPYMSHYRPYERSNSTSSAVVAMPPSTGFDRKRQHHRRSLTESDAGTNGSNNGSGSASNCLDSTSANRPSVLRDGKGRSTALSPSDLTSSYRGSGLNDGSGQPNDSSRFNNDSGESGERGSSAGGGNVNNNFDRPPLSVGSGNGDNCNNSDIVNCKEENRQNQQAPQSTGGSNFDPGPVGPDGNVCRRRGRPPSTPLGPTDLRIKLEPLHATGLRGDEISAATYKELKQVAAAAAAAAAGNDKEIAASLWNSTTKQAAHKGGSVATPDGKKLKCPFCERLYGYETNLRAHIRQRHQGIRVPCPFCSRTFTRNNTVRRHIAREHKTELSMKTAAAAASAAAAAAAAASSCFSLPNHSQ